MHETSQHIVETHHFNEVVRIMNDLKQWVIKEQKELWGDVELRSNTPIELNKKEGNVNS